MKKKSILLLLTSILFSFCQKAKEKEPSFDLNNYIELNIEKFEYEGKVLDFINVRLINNKDSIGTIINKNPRRYEYLLTNRIDIDSISKAMPDTTKAKSIFKSSINDKSFKKYFYTTFYSEKETKTKFTEKELMKVASKFFLSEKMGDKFSTRICIGINGLDAIELKKRDYTLLEAIAYEAIFEQIMRENVEEPTFMKNLNKYSDKAVSLIDKDVKDTLFFVREAVFNSMENDKDLKTHLINYIDKNQENIAIEIEK